MSWNITTTQDFSVFIQLLWMYLDKIFGWKECWIVIVLDNTSIYWTIVSNLTEKSYNMNIIWAHLYSPHLTPVEFEFGMVKGHIKYQSSD